MGNINYGLIDNLLKHTDLSMGKIAEIANVGKTTVVTRNRRKNIRPLNKKMQNVSLAGGGKNQIDYKDKIKEIADYYRLNRQLTQALEECCELNQVICKIQRKGITDHYSHLMEEIADVEIMCEELKYLCNGYKDVEKIKKFKIERELKRIEDDKNESKNTTKR